MQSEAADAFDVTREPISTREAYGDSDFARQTLIARRLVERGVRYVQLYTGAGQPWDNHDDLVDRHRDLAKTVDQPIAALLSDLKRTGLLDETLVIWGGEFGRTPVVEMPRKGANQGKMNGRDHNHYGFTVWMAGGGVRGGSIVGATDEIGFPSDRKPSARPRSARNDLAADGLGPRTADIPLRRSRLSLDRCPRPGRGRDSRVVGQSNHAEF